MNVSISVVIPLYNKAAHIERAVRSVLSQTVQDFEIVVVNDASTDGGEARVKGFGDPRIRMFHRLRPGPGGHAARNLGARCACSPLVAFLDADDAYQPDFLATVLRLSERFPRAGAYATAYEIQETGGRRVRPGYSGIPGHPWEGLIPEYFFSVLDPAPPVWTSAVAVRKEVFGAVGYFPEGEKKGGDQDMWLRIALEYPIAFSTCRGAVYFRDAENRIGDTVFVSEYKLVRTAREALRTRDLSERAAMHLREYIAKYQIQWAAHLVLAGRQEKAREVLDGCVTDRFRAPKNWWSVWAMVPGPFLRLALKAKRFLNRIR